MTMLFKARVELFRGEILRNATHPLFYVCRLFGVLPYNTDYTFSKGWLQYSFLLCIAVFVNNTILEWVVIGMYDVSYLVKSMDKLLLILQSFIENLCILAQLVSVTVYRSGFNQLLVGLRGLNEFKTVNNYNRYGVAICIIKLVLQIAGQSYTYGMALDFSTYIFLSSCIGSFIFGLVNLEYCGILELLRYQFGVVTEELRPNQYTLVPLTKRHHVLLELTTTLNEVFSWQLLIMCTGIFINLVTTLYVCIQALSDLQKLTVLGTAGMCLWQICLLFSLAISCEETREKAEGFNNELFKLMRESKDLCSNEKLHLYVTMKQTLNFSACGFFTIGYPLVTSLSESFYSKLKNVIDSVTNLIDGYLHTTRGREDHTIYTGYTGLALSNFLIYKNTKCMTSFDVAKKLTDTAITRLSGELVSFFTGDAGPLALGTVLYALDDNIDRSSELRLWLLQLGQNASPDIPCSLIDGWAGYLYALLFVNKHIPGTIPTQIIRKTVTRILTSGVTLAIRKRSAVPLMYEWKGKHYAGPLHGLCGILYMVLCSGVLEETETYNIVRPTLDSLVEGRSPRKNYPAFVDNEDDILVQWCHGSPGFVQLFIKASEVVDPSFMTYAVEAADVVWNYGVLSKGYTLCHGLAGNAYSFLALYRKTGERKHLLRATGFIEWCLSYPRFERENPDRPYSLLKGYTGLLYFLTDVKDIPNTAFPGYEL